MCDLYNRIHGECEKYGMTDAKLRHDLGYPASTLSDLKTGKKKTLSQDKLIAIAQYLNVTIDYLVLGKKEKAPTLTDEDSEVKEIFTQLTEQNKKIALAQLKAILDNQ